MKNCKLKRLLLRVYDWFYWKKLFLNDKILRKKYGRVNVLSIDDTLDYLIKEKCSMSRYGDGEYKLICGESIRFQEYNSRLSERLYQILQEKERYFVCISDVFNNPKWMTERAYDYTWKIVAQNRKRWMSFLSTKGIYGNAFISRCYLDWKDKSRCELWFQKLKELWNEEEIVIVEGDKSRLGYQNDLFDNVNSIERVLCPPQNAFSFYDVILNRLKELPKNKLIILALGPTATVLAYDLTQAGYRALDIGHVDIEYEWFLRKATEKIKIENKYVNEAKGGDSVMDISDQEFLSQIIDEITEEEVSDDGGVN